jgi:hypothetical protein
MFKKLFKKKKVSSLAEIREKDGHKVLTKTEDFRLYVIRDNSDEILGTILLTEGQQNVLNKSINDQGIHFTRK